MPTPFEILAVTAQIELILLILAALFNWWP